MAANHKFFDSALREGASFFSIILSHFPWTKNEAQLVRYAFCNKQNLMRPSLHVRANSLRLSTSKRRVCVCVCCLEKAAVRSALSNNPNSHNSNCAPRTRTTAATTKTYDKHIWDAVLWHRKLVATCTHNTHGSLHSKFPSHSIASERRHCMETRTAAASSRNVRNFFLFALKPKSPRWSQNQYSNPF